MRSKTFAFKLAQQMIHVFAITRLQRQFNLGRFHAKHAEQTLMFNVHDVRSGVTHCLGELRERPSHVRHLHAGTARKSTEALLPPKA